MGRATLYDAFTAAAGFTGNVLNFAGAINQEHARSELALLQAKQRDEMQRILTSLDGRNDFANFSKVANDALDAWAKGDTAKVSSPYAERIKQQMLEESRLVLNQAVDAKVLKAKGEYTLVNNEQQRNLNLQSNLETQTLINENQNSYDSEYATGLVNYSTYMSNTLFNGSNAILKKSTDAGMQVLQSGGSLSEALEAIDKIDVESIKLTALTAASATQEALDSGKAERIDVTNKIDKKATQQKARKEVTAYYNTIIKDMQQRNDNALSERYLGVTYAPLGKQADLCRQAKADMMRNMGGNRLTSDDRKKWTDAFDRILNNLESSSGGTGSGRSAKVTQYEFIARNMLARFLEDTKNGAYKNVPEAREAFIRYCVNEAYNQGYEGDVERLEPVFGKHFAEFTEKAVSVLGEPYKPVLEEAKKLVDTLNKRFNKDDTLFAGSIKKELAQYFYSMIEDGETDNEKLVESATRFVRSQYGEALDAIRKNPLSGKGGYIRSIGESDEKNHIKFLQSRDSTDLVYTDSAGREHWIEGTKEGVENAIQFERNYLSKLLGTDEKNIGTDYESQYGGHDKTAVAVHKVGNDFYRFRTAGKKLIIEREVEPARGRQGAIWESVKTIKEIEKDKKKELKTQQNKLEQAQRNAATDASEFADGLPSYRYTAGWPKRTIKEITREKWETMSPEERQNAIEAFRRNDPEGYKRWIEQIKARRGE